ncbi:MAG TPA: cyclic nucleotide-binding domain-containing protein [Candidatus Eisenbacteria bacterium]|nr:cyclic nucleotide-binding domain-containing protein [Candidatus Eisenbacteria bacterium]
MLTPVERVLILKNADLLSDVGPRHLLGLAEAAREVEISKGDRIYKADDAADALYMVVEGRVKLSTDDRPMSEVGPGEAFGTWSLVDDSARGHRAECVQDGLLLALHRDEFYDVAAGDLPLLQVVVRALARRLRALVAERPEEARVESEGVEAPDTTPAAESETTPPATPGTTLAAAALGRPHPQPETPPEPLPTRDKGTKPQ